MEKYLKLLKNKDEKAFQHIVETYWVRIHKFAQIYTRNDDVSKEITQDTFLKLWEKKEELLEETCLISYLTVICRNKCLDYLRKKQMRFVSIDEVSDDMIYDHYHLGILENKTSDLLLAKELNKIVRNIVDQLPEKTRMIFEKSRKEAKMNKEIAEELNVSIKTIEFHISKALQKLKKEIPTEYYIMIALFILVGK